MPNESSVTIFDNSVTFAEATNTQSTGTEFRYSGRMDEDIVLGDLDDTYETWVSVASRRGTVRVSFRYGGGDNDEYDVEPGLPLLIQNTRVGSNFTSITFSKVTDSEVVEVEIQCYPGTNPKTPEAAAFLILNAGTGITEDEFAAGKVTAWTDTRPESGAPLPFEWSDGTAVGVTSTDAPSIISSDPDFGGRSSVAWAAHAGNSLFFDYSDRSTTIFNFMRGRAEAGQDFTVMSILSVEDTALPTRVASGVWNTVKSGSYAGFKGSVDGGYRVYTQLFEGANDSDMRPDELIEKPSVVIWRFTGATSKLRVYSQGEWSEEIDFSHAAGGAVDSSEFQVGFTHESLGESFFQGKIADIRVYDSAVSAENYNSYIAMAVNEYGIDDTAEQGFPRMTGAINFHRANRGDIGGGWFDMRTQQFSGTTDGYYTGSGSGTPFAPVLEPLLNNQPVFEFDGVADYATNNYNAAGDHLGGDGMTIAMVYYQRGGTNIKGLFTMEDYGAGADNLAGTNIEYYGGSPGILRYEVDNAANAVVAVDYGVAKPVSTPRAIVVRADGATLWIDEIDLATGIATSSSVTFSGSATATTTLTAYLFTYPSRNASDFLEGALAEYWTEDDDITDAQVTEYFTYCRRRYGT